MAASMEYLRNRSKKIANKYKELLNKKFHGNEREEAVRDFEQCIADIDALFEAASKYRYLNNMKQTDLFNIEEYEIDRISATTAKDYSK